MMACIHFASEVKYDVSEMMLLNLLKLIITLSFLLNYTTKLRKSPALWGLFIYIMGYYVPTSISLPNKKGAWSKERRYDMDPVDDKFDSYPYMKARNRGNKAIMDYQKNGCGK